MMLPTSFDPPKSASGSRIGESAVLSTISQKKRRKRRPGKRRLSSMPNFPLNHKDSIPGFGTLSLYDAATQGDMRLPCIPTPPASSKGSSTRQASTPQGATLTSLERRKKLPILAAIKPENERSEKDRFMRANYNYNPLFVYRHPADPEVLQRYGTPSAKFLPQAILIIENVLQKYGTYENFEEKVAGKVLTRAQITNCIKRYLKVECLEDEVLVNLSEDLLSRGSMTRSKGRAVLNVRVVNMRENWLDGLLRHEIGTHYLRSCNNRYQPWSNWKVRKQIGLRGLNPTEEGLASLHSVLFYNDACLWRSAMLYYTTYMAAFLSFKELFKDLGCFITDPMVRWDYCIRAKRGQKDTMHPGGFCKDQVYLDGALQILRSRHLINFPLLIQLGKVSFEDIERLQDLAEIDNTRIPMFMQNLPNYRMHLDLIAEANKLTDEVLLQV